MNIVPLDAVNYFVLFGVACVGILFFVDYNLGSGGINFTLSCILLQNTFLLS